MPLPPLDQATIAYLRSPIAIRDRCQQLFDLACVDRLPYFRCDFSRLDDVAGYVLQVTRDCYPTLDIPFHSRWRHFEVGTRQRLAELAARLAPQSPLERAQAEWDLAIVSVLLDAGAGAEWHYREPSTGEVFNRSEGLAVASFDLFCNGCFSSDPQSPLQVDAIGLQSLTASTLGQGLQVKADNPIVGLQGRLELLQRLGQTLQQFPKLGGGAARPGYLLNAVLPHAQDGQIAASQVLSAVLESFSAIWTGRLAIADIPLGDVWQHPALPADPPYANLVPFHKLSQWLTYSLLEPLQTLGLTILDLDALTGLPEYRNGGLCLDLGLLQVKDPIVLQQAHLPSDPVIVEWRALTVILLDRIAQTLRQQLHLPSAQLPLVKILQGGTWTAGRRIAASLREGGTPPLQITSDGTVF